MRILNLVHLFHIEEAVVLILREESIESKQSRKIVKRGIVLSMISQMSLILDIEKTFSG